MHYDFVYLASLFFLERKKRQVVKGRTEKITGRKKLKEPNKHRLNFSVNKSQIEPFHERGAPHFLAPHLGLGCCRSRAWYDAMVFAGEISPPFSPFLYPFFILPLIFPPSLFPVGSFLQHWSPKRLFASPHLRLETLKTPDLFFLTGFVRPTTLPTTLALEAPSKVQPWPRRGCIATDTKTCSQGNHYPKCS